MSTIDDGGPAFPTSADNGHSTNQDGMTLRDWFAGQALAGWLASFGESAQHPVIVGSAFDIAGVSYKMADHMIQARKISSEEVS